MLCQISDLSPTFSMLPSLHEHKWSARSAPSMCIILTSPTLFPREDGAHETSDSAATHRSQALKKGGDQLESHIR